MWLAVLSLVALLVAIAISSFRQQINAGIVSILFALGIGMLALGSTPKAVLTSFPIEIVVLLISVTLFFGMAQKNGSLGIITHWCTQLTRGHGALLPPLFFLLTFGLSALGPGNIAATALVAPIAMVLAVEAGISPLLMAIAVCTGANAGAFSPLSPTGIITQGLLNKISMNGEVAWRVFLSSAAIQSLSAAAGYVLLKGFRAKQISVVEVKQTELRWTPLRIVTAVLMVGLVVSVALLHVPMMLAALVAAVLLGLCGDDQEAAISEIPWSIILLVSGISVLVGIVEKAGGLELATNVLGQYTPPQFIHAMLAGLTGLVSVYSSSSGVVLPAFIPLVPGLLKHLPNANPADLVTAIAVGSHMVDVSPLSTLGALCIAAYPLTNKRPALFRQLLYWGLSMTLAATVLGYVFLDVL